MNTHKLDSKHFLILVSCLILSAGLLGGCKAGAGPAYSVPAGAQSGDLNITPCIYKAGEVKYAADCGTLIVPENRADLKSRLIALPLTRVRSTGDSPSEPIFFLPGGPGLPNSGTSRVRWFVDKHDLVFVGYRGVDGSVQLDCPEISDHFKNLPGDMLGAVAMEQMTVAYGRCAERLQSEGVDLAGYSAVDVVDDLEEARLALGYGQVDLFSISYGTRLAMIYAWRYPESVHRSALVAVNPPGHMFHYDPAVIDTQIEYYSALCAQEPRCSRQTDNLAEDMRSVSKNMPERWLGFPIDRGMIRAASFESLSDTKAAPKVFDVWLAAARGDYSGMVLLSLAGPMMFSDAAVWGDNIAKAASADYEMTSEARSQMDLAGSILGSPRSEMAAAAAGWPIATIPEEYQRSQSSDVETLLLSGSIDPWTPWQFAEDELLPKLSRGQHVVISEAGHAEMLWRQPEASSHLLNTFFDTGTGDGSLFTYQAWEYKVGLGFSAIAKIILTVVLLALTGLVLLARFILRRAGFRKESA